MWGRSGKWLWGEKDSLQVIIQLSAVNILSRLILAGRVRRQTTWWCYSIPLQLPGSPPKSRCIIIRLAFINVNILLSNKRILLYIVLCIMHNVSSFQLVKGRATSTSRRAEESLSVASNDSPELTTSHPKPQPNDVSISTLNIIS